MADTPTTNSPGPTPKFEKTDLTYGVEIEAVFAFDVDQLNPYLSKGDYTVRILKQETRKKLTQFQPVNKNQALRLYNSRGVHKRGQADLVPYNDEPLKIVQEKVKAVRPNIKCIPTMGETAKGENTVGKYNEWIITKDHSVTGIPSTKIPDHLPHISTTQAAQNWDTYGIELISRVLQSNNKSHKQEISSIINALKQVESPSTKTGAFTTDHCALHVHVQIDKYDEGFLATLAAILLIYEEEISRLHPPHRRPGHPSTTGMIESNRLRLFLSPLTTETETSSLPCKTLDLKLRSENRPSCKIQNIISNLSRIIDREGKKGLIEYMNFPKNTHGEPIRDRVVNFVPIDRPDFNNRKLPKTVEFRQHVGTLCPEGIGKWIDFCVGIVRLAEFWWRVPEAFPVGSWEDERIGDGYGVGWRRNRICVFDLLRGMGADGDVIRFWEDRVAGFELEGEGKVGDGDGDDYHHHPDGNSLKGETRGMRGGHSGDTDDSKNGFEGQQSAPHIPTTPITNNNNKRRNSNTSPPRPLKKLKTGTNTSPPRSPPKKVKKLSKTSPLSPTTRAKQQEITTIQTRLGSLNTRFIISKKNIYKFESDTWDVLVQRLQELGNTDWDKAQKPLGPLRDLHSPTLSTLGGELHEVNQRLELLNRTSARISFGSGGSVMECTRLEIQVLEERKRELERTTTAPPQSTITSNSISNLTPQQLNTLLSTPTSTTDIILIPTSRNTVRSVQDITASIQIPQPGQPSPINNANPGPQPGDTYSVAQGNALCAEHMTYGQSGYVYVTNFNPNSWIVDWGHTQLIYNNQLRHNVCGAYALYNSLTAQYPATLTNPSISPSALVAALDTARISLLTSVPNNTQDIFGRYRRTGNAGGNTIEGGDHSSEEMAIALNAVMGNGYQLIVWDQVSMALFPRERAHRVGGGVVGMFGWGNNVYVTLQGYDATERGTISRGGSGHWSGMRRR